MAQNRRLVVLPVSPWSERARWALDHHALAHEVVVHEPFLGERRLRRLVGPGKERATVPVLVAGDQVLADSWDIALYADRCGSAAKLIPPDKEAEIRRWNARVDEAMTAGRGLVVSALLESPGALDESLAPNVPAFLRPLLRPVTRYGTRWFARKYGLEAGDLPALEAQFRTLLEELRAALSGRPYLLGSFSYADMVAATALQGVLPVHDRYLPLGPATREVWTKPRLAADFADLMAWRDGLYERHRKPGPVAVG